MQRTRRDPYRSDMIVPRAVVLSVLAAIVAACAAVIPDPATSPPSPGRTATSTQTPGPTLALSPQPSPTPPPQVPGWVVQTRSSILLFADNGQRISSASGQVPGNPTNPDWSPDGTQLTFGATDDNGRDDLWIVNADGSEPQLVFDCESTCEYIDDPAWSPNGQEIAVCKLVAEGDDHVGSLLSIDIESGAQTTLFTPEPFDFCAGPRWSPDGEALVFELVHRDGATASSNVTGVSLAILEVGADEPPVLLTERDLYAATADWSRVTGLIVYSALPSAGATEAQLFTIEADGSDSRQLTDLAGGAIEPSFDAAGTSVVFVGSGPLSRVDLESGTTAPAFENAVAGNHPRARPQ